jgi:flagellar protein FliS
VGYPSARTYRDNEVYSASPAQLLIITFDYLISQMTRARIGLETNKQDVTLAALDRARYAAGELLATIDPNDHNELPRNLRSLYVFLLAELVEIGRTRDAVRLEKNTANVRELREAWAAAAEQQRTAAGRAEVA